MHRCLNLGIFVTLCDALGIFLIPKKKKKKIEKITDQKKNENFDQNICYA